MEAVLVVLPFVLFWLIIAAALWYGFRIVRSAARLLEKHSTEGVDAGALTELQARVHLLEQQLEDVQATQRQLSEAADFQAELLKTRNQP